MNLADIFCVCVHLCVTPETKKVAFLLFKGGILSWAFLIFVEGDTDNLEVKNRREEKMHKNDANCMQLLRCTSEALPKNLCLFWVN